MGRIRFSKNSGLVAEGGAANSGAHNSAIKRRIIQTRHVGGRKTKLTDEVKKPVVQPAITDLKHDAEYDVPGSPDWMAIGERGWVSNKPKNSDARHDPKTNKPETIAVGNKPCSGLDIGFGSLWVPSCGDQT